MPAARSLRANPHRASRHRGPYARPLEFEDSPTGPCSKQAEPQRPLAELLKADSQNELSLGVDFGTVNTSASLVELRKGDAQNLDFIKKIQPIRTDGEEIRFPTLVAVKPDRLNRQHGRLIFASQVKEALGNGQITADDIVSYPKFGLIKSFEGIFEQDRPVIADAQERHRRALERISQYKLITVEYKNSTIQHQVSLNTIEDVIVQYLRFFLGIVKDRLATQLGLTHADIETVFKLENVVTGFASPAFWTDEMLDNFLRLIEKAGWPSKARIWSEPKAAAIAHIAVDYTTADSGVGETQRRFLRGMPIILGDIGGASLDTTTFQPVNVTENTIRLASVAESGGSLCGGRVLDRYIESKMLEKLGQHYESIRLSVSNDSQPLNEQDFLQSFQYENCRRDFDAKNEEYIAYYGGNNLPAASHRSFMTTKGVIFTKEDMIKVHESYLKGVIVQIRDQIARTKASLGSNATFRLMMCGGVTRSNFLMDRLKQEFQGKEGVIDIITVERVHIPLVAYGCILCLRQPGFGGRGKSRFAYAIPSAKIVAVPKHRSKRRSKGGRLAPQHTETRDLADWIVQVGSDASLGKVYSELFNFDIQLLHDDGSPLTKDPTDSNHYANLDITIEQQILSTSDPIVGCLDAPPYKDHPCIDTRKVVEFKLSRNQVLKINARSICEKIGLWQEEETCHWYFSIAAKLILDWPDMRLR